MARGPTILFALLAGAVALVLWLGAVPGNGEPQGEHSVLAPNAADDGGALTPARTEPQGIVHAPETAPARDPRAAATPAAPQRAAAELTLEVLDASTGRPVAAFFATVLPQGLHAQGRDGAAHFTGLSAGSLTIQVQGPEHEPTVASAALPAAGPVQVRLAQRTGLRGIVRFADARPAPDVVLRLEMAPGTSLSAPEGQGTPSPVARELANATLAKTGPDGRYRFAPLPPGRYTVVGEHLGRALAPLGPFDVTAGMTDLPELRLDAGTRLEIEVRDPAGVALGNVLLVIVPADGSGSALRRYSGSDGELVLEPLAPGRYTITMVAQAGQAEQRRQLELTVGLHRESFRVDPGTPAVR